MVKVDYICTKDINRVAKIHSNKKYVNWNLKVVDNEFRFYPPITININEDDILDDFEFNNMEDDELEVDSLFEPVCKKVQNIPMFGEIWETGKFIKENKFNFVSVLEESLLDRKIKGINKYSQRSIKIEKFKDNSNLEERISKNSSSLVRKEKFITKSDDFYKLYKVKDNRSCLTKIKKYENDLIEDNNQKEVSSLGINVNSIFDKFGNDIEILSFEEEYA